ncbi:Coenzyme F420 hydrogenase/dehydrogenase, beta subunit C-terminal domain [Halothiobacillus sp.]|uniref:Coenzyme F420 hydrogenase/dehydrogenase, beta subunit C-terminal domain n=1 Tax=Halothiobacillus sp. TaxID=1891311 RepID=UPI00260D2152|nr:Coenzyme F420 hydrogenase/dehydrogenase, beta subunit C-terminal domain [Halothiobacillus sp.]MDD4965738.1 Coenzyme F420 hydrogenase/dehydrogenase, beta subunit C-terminal domain [Halothiobacillus sp.]
MRLFGRGRTKEERWFGVMQGVYGGRSTDPETYRRSASGGSATTLLREAARQLALDWVLVMGREPARPWRSAPAICTDFDRLADYAQSTYQLAPYLGALRGVLLDERPLRGAMSGIACQVQGIRKLQGLDSAIGERARERVAFIVEIGCSSSTKPEGTASMITERLGTELSAVHSIHYREGEYPGQIVVRTIHGKRHEIAFWEAVRHFKDNKTHRCLSCGDWMSGLADVSISDGDPNIFQASQGVTGIEKHGRVFVRTERGRQVLEEAVVQGEMECWPIELTGLNLGLERKRNRRAYYEGSGLPLSDGPIAGFREEREVVDDEQFIPDLAPSPERKDS